MNGDDPKFVALDSRMRRMLAGLDAEAGFEARVMQRVAASTARAGAASADLRAQFERRREIVRRRLRREAWSNAITIASGGVAAFALVWHYSAEIVRWVTESDLQAANEPVLLLAVAVAAVAAALWPLRGRLTDRLK
jgi:hypothetical protein